MFADRYQRFAYFERERSFAPGFLTILIQGVILSVLFPMIGFTGTSKSKGLKFARLIGALFWTSHVLAFVARQQVQNVYQFIGMETAYLALQFGIFGVLILIIYRNKTSD